jgi:hypothetical protein
MGEMSRLGLTDRMIYQRHVGRFLIFPVCGVWFEKKKRTVLLDKDRKMDKVQKYNICLSLLFSYFCSLFIPSPYFYVITK